jgi:YHS domain-containing protein
MFFSPHCQLIMHTISIRCAALLVAALTTLAHAAEPVSTGWMNGAAIGGKDAVSYHSAEVKASRQVMEGNSTFTVEYLGVPWRFASKVSAHKFAANPAAYLPQYNGHCSNALALGEGLIPSSGSVWEFFDNKLHLFYAERGRQRWLTGDWKAYRQQADNAWQDILATKR